MEVQVSKPEINYNVYRHDLLRSSLKKQYNDYQPPGDVVLNSFYLNSEESTNVLRAEPSQRFIDNFRVGGESRHQLSSKEKATDTAEVEKFNEALRLEGFRSCQSSKSSLNKVKK